MGVVDIIVFFAFIAGVIGIGLIKSKSEHSEEGGAADYFLAGRGLTWWLIGVSLIAANISAEQFVGMSGQAASYLGLAIASYEWMAAVTLVVVAFAFLPYFLKTGIYTIPGFLEHRYNHVARSTMAVFMMIILVGVSLSGVIYAGALPMRDLLIDSGVNVTLRQCCWTMGILAAVYVAAGGLKACAWADLIQGTALVLGGAIIAWLAFKALGAAPVADLVRGVGATTDLAAAAPVVAEGAGTWERFTTLNADKLHMFLPKSDKIIPWTALCIGLWIPNFYYWGLNQYITQRILGSASLSEGQKGIVFAAALKLIIPFIIVFPGIIAFNLFSTDMEKKAEEDFLKAFDKISAEEQVSTLTFKPLEKWTAANPVKAQAIAVYNAKVEAAAKESGKATTVKEQAPYKADSALGLLIGRLIPKGKGLFGFVIAALLGAIISSLAAVLNAASTIFSMDIYHSYINKKASQKQLVAVGRICVGVFVVIGCIVSPLLDNPKFGGIFTYIQEFQGYVSPGILAVFVFGLLNRTAAGPTGVIGLLANPFIYGFLKIFCPHIDFLNRMAICLFGVLAIMFIVGLFCKLEKPVEFKSNTTMNLDSSKGAKIVGAGVIIVTAILYVIFR